MKSSLEVAYDNGYIIGKKETLQKVKEAVEKFEKLKEICNDNEIDIAFEEMKKQLGIE